MALDGDSTANTLETKDDLGKSPEAQARRWKLELKLAAKRELKWREKVKEIRGYDEMLSTAVHKRLEGFLQVPF